MTNEDKKLFKDILLQLKKVNQNYSDMRKLLEIPIKYITKKYNDNQ